MNALFASTWPKHRRVPAQPLLQRALVYVCAYEGKQLVGFAKVIGDGGVHGFLLDPTVAPEHQRQGLGRRLVVRCAQEARRRGVEWLHVDFEPRLAKFYRACGFSPTTAGLWNLKASKTRAARRVVE
ncbi:MAG: GNAT family N-acetyltransferase [Opitutaceae bacterium]